MTIEIRTTYEFVLAQYADESFLNDVDIKNEQDDDFKQRLVFGANHPDFIPKSIQDGQLSATQMTNVMINDFFDTWEVIDQLPNTNSGFSATVLKNKNTEEFTLSFRSTESGCGVRSCLAFCFTYNTTYP